MFAKIELLEKVKMTVARTSFFLGCIAIVLLTLQNPVHGGESDTRTELLRVLELQLSVAESLGRSDLTATLEKAIEDVQFASDADLDPVASGIDEIQNYGDSLQILDATIQQAVESGETESLETPSFLASTEVAPVSLTPPAYFDGGALGILCRLPDATIGVRNNTEIVLNAKIALGVAKTAWAGAEVACGLDLVALASGGLGAVACGVLAVAVAAAEEIVDGFLRCDATVDEAHLDAAFIRAEDNFLLGTHIHDSLATHDTNIDGDLVAHDLKISSQLSQHDTDIKALLSDIVANQRLIIKLLKTPQGRRPEWNE